MVMIIGNHMQAIAKTKVNGKPPLVMTKIDGLSFLMAIMIYNKQLAIKYLVHALYLPNEII